MINDNLSEKIVELEKDIDGFKVKREMLYKKDVREAVKKLKEWINQDLEYYGHNITEKLDEIFGESLTGEDVSNV